jgi:hypothetical protein
VVAVVAGVAVVALAVVVAVAVAVVVVVAPSAPVLLGCVAEVPHWLSPG